MRAGNEGEGCRVGGNFCQNGGTCTKLKPNDVRVLSSSNEMIYRLQLAALSSTESERQRILGFRCTCTSGFEGEFCQTRTLCKPLETSVKFVVDFFVTDRPLRPNSACYNRIRRLIVFVSADSYSARKVLRGTSEFRAEDYRRIVFEYWQFRDNKRLQ